MVCQFVDIRRNCRISATWFGEDYFAREREQPPTIPTRGQSNASLDSLRCFWVQFLGVEPVGDGEARPAGGSRRSPGHQLLRGSNTVFGVLASSGLRMVGCARRCHWNRRGFPTCSNREADGTAIA